MLFHSERPEVQEYRLYRELNKEIEIEKEKDRVRYAESKPHLRANSVSGAGGSGYSQLVQKYSVPSGSSEVQSAIINISTTQQASGSKLKPQQSPSKSIYEASSSTKDPNEILLKSNCDPSGHAVPSNQKSVVVGGNCQVCLIRELKDDLTNVTKLIMERNEQLTSKLKAKRLRTFFEKQMLN